MVEPWSENFWPCRWLSQLCATLTANDNPAIQFNLRWRTGWGRNYWKLYMLARMEQHLKILLTKHVMFPLFVLIFPMEDFFCQSHANYVHQSWPCFSTLNNSVIFIKQSTSWKTHRKEKGVQLWRGGFGLYHNHQPEKGLISAERLDFVMKLSFTTWSWNYMPKRLFTITNLPHCCCLKVIFGLEWWWRTANPLSKSTSNARGY